MDALAAGTNVRITSGAYAGQYAVVSAQTPHVLSGGVWPVQFVTFDDGSGVWVSRRHLAEVT